MPLNLVSIDVVHSLELVVALGAGTIVLAWLTRTLLMLPALALVPTVSRHLARWVRPREYSVTELLAADGAPPEWVLHRRNGLTELAGRLSNDYSRSSAF